MRHDRGRIDHHEEPMLIRIRSYEIEISGGDENWFMCSYFFKAMGNDSDLWKSCLFL